MAIFRSSFCYFFRVFLLHSSLYLSVQIWTICVTKYCHRHNFVSNSWLPMATHHNPSLDGPRISYSAELEYPLHPFLLGLNSSDQLPPPPSTKFTSIYVVAKSEAYGERGSSGCAASVLNTEKPRLDGCIQIRPALCGQDPLPGFDEFP